MRDFDGSRTGIVPAPSWLLLLLAVAFFYALVNGSLNPVQARIVVHQDPSSAKVDTPGGMQLEICTWWVSCDTHDVALNDDNELIFDNKGRPWHVSAAPGAYALSPR